MARKRNQNDPPDLAEASGAAPASSPIGEGQLTEPLISSPWTRAPARVRFRSLIQQSIERGTKQPNYLFAVFYIDLDRFTIVNNSLGRDIGDQLLLEVVRRLRGCLRPGDTIARLREDEYLIFLDNIEHLSNALQFAKRLWDAMHPAFRLSGHEVFASASVGIALGPRGYSKAEEIVRDAEAAMHGSKTKGPGSYQVFDSKMYEEARTLLKLETQLRGAIEQRQLQLQFQPIVSLENGGFAGFEALLRWLHPDRGMVYPGEFVPAAEEAGLIVPITQWVLQEACRHLKKWQDLFPAFSSLWMSVNLSPSYIKKTDFAQELFTFVAESGVDASNLALEITESQFLENADDISKGLTILHDTGIKLWIDDFGAGYSSFAYLVNFPIHSLKIDQSFVLKVIHDANSAAITKAIVSLGKALGLNVIAEGVETTGQLDYLRSVGCPYGQGHHFGRSIDADTIEAIFGGKQGP